MPDGKEPTKSQQESTGPDSGVVQPPAPPPQQPPAPPNANQPNDNPNPPEPIAVRLIDSGELKPFEIQTLNIARDNLAIAQRTYRVAVFAFFAAVAAAIFVYSQVRLMAYQTEIMGAQTDSATAGGLFSDMNTRKQLRIAQEQADAAQKNVAVVTKQMREDQRSWIKITQTDPLNFVENQPFINQLHFQDIGKTAARNVKIEAVVEKLPISKGPLLSYKKGIARSIGTTGIAFPNEPFTVPVVFMKMHDAHHTEKIILSKADVDDLKNGLTYIAIYARASYSDIFGVRHLSTFCTFASPSIGPIEVTAKGCSDYNSVDNK